MNLAVYSSSKHSYINIKFSSIHIFYYYFCDSCAWLEKKWCAKLYIHWNWNRLVNWHNKDVSSDFKIIVINDEIETIFEKRNSITPTFDNSKWSSLGIHEIIFFSQKIEFSINFFVLSACVADTWLKSMFTYEIFRLLKV